MPTEGNPSLLPGKPKVLTFKYGFNRLQEKCRKVWEQIIVKLIHKHPIVERANHYAANCVDVLFSYYMGLDFNGEDRGNSYGKDGLDELSTNMGGIQKILRGAREEFVCDFISGLTDEHALRVYQKLCYPDFLRNMPY